jgi:hypothetical protein
MVAAESEFFDAVKIEKVGIEERRVIRIEKAGETHAREYEALVKQLQGLQIVAQISGILLDMNADEED